MEKINSLLSSVLSALGIISSVWGFLIYLYKKSIGRLQEISDELASLSKLVKQLEEERKSGPDAYVRLKFDHMRASVDLLNNRVNQMFLIIEHKHEQGKLESEAPVKQTDLARPIFPKVFDHAGRIIDRDTQKIPNSISKESIEARVKELEDIAALHRGAITKIHKAVAVHQSWLKELRSRKL